MASYIRLVNSNGSVDKKFSVVQMKEQKKRTDSFDYTLGGKLDKQSGPIINQWNYVLWVDIDTAHATGYGIWSEFSTLFSYTNPNATPSDVITLYDHFGTSHYVYFAEGAAPEPVCARLTGSGAFYMVPVLLVEKA